MGLFTRKGDKEGGAGQKAPPWHQRADGMAGATTSRKTGTVGGTAPKIEVVHDEHTDTQWAFGLRWRSMVGAVGLAAAQEIVTKAKGSHFIVRHTSVGYCTLPKEVSGSVYCAAAVAARKHLGTAIFCLNLQPQQYWFAVAQNGSPSGVDEVIGGMGEREAAEHVRAIIAQYKGEAVTVLTDIPPGVVDGQLQFALHDLIDLFRDDSDSLTAIAKQAISIPKPFMYAGFAGMLLIAGVQGWSYWDEYQKAQALQAVRSQEESPEEAWGAAFKKFLAAHTKASPEALDAVRASLGNVPVYWHGWVLTGARCKAGDFNAARKQRPWTCQATYERARVADTTEQFKSLVEKSGLAQSVTFTSISTAQLGWSIQQPAEPMAINNLQEQDKLNVGVASILQEYLPALAAKPDFKMASLELEAPKRPDGKAHPKPPSIPTVYRGELVLKGPLRSIDTLTGQLPMVEWEAVGLVYSKGSPTETALGSSLLMAEVTGKAYGKKAQAALLQAK